tara:strand:- start:1507 stop:1773 length:267 start_codon:yes stop_codon:yes gene_type:complete
MNNFDARSRFNQSMLPKPFKSIGHLNKFVEDVFELAFGDNAINMGFTPDVVVDTLRRYSTESYKYEILQQVHEVIKDNPERILMKAKA